MRLVLCSGSPRRREMLSRLGLRFDVEIPRIAEERAPGERIVAYPERLAREKAAAGLESWRKRGGQGPAVALAADTVVVLEEEVLEKPRDRGDAERMLRKLSGVEHRVITGVCVATDREVRSRALVTGVRLRGAGPGGSVRGARGRSFSNVVGLPLTETLQLLAGAGLRMPWG